MVDLHFLSLCELNLESRVNKIILAEEYKTDVRYSFKIVFKNNGNIQVSVKI